MFKTKIQQQQLPLFFILTLGLSAAVVAAAAVSQTVDLAILAVFVPSLVAIALTGFTGGRSGLKALLIDPVIRKIRLPWLTAALFIFPLLGVTAGWFYAAISGAPFSLLSPGVDSLIGGSILVPLGEEFGWRGFALPRLQKRFSALTASLILGLLWGLWHFPASLIGTGVPLEMPFWIFMLWVLAATIIMTWVYNQTKSVVTAVLLHGTANATFNLVPLLPEFVGNLAPFWLFLGLLGAFVLLILIIFGPDNLVRRV